VLRSSIAIVIGPTPPGSARARPLRTAQPRARRLQQDHHARRRARPQARHPEREPARAGGREAVDVLARRDPVGDLGAVEVVRDRQLTEDPADVRIGVEAVDERQHVGPRHVAGQRVWTLRMPPSAHALRLAAT
jgi:hypothetical protein